MKRFSFYLVALMSALIVASCAKMGEPDGGWFDETPPRILGSTPIDRATNVLNNKINIYFDEFIKLDNPTENLCPVTRLVEAKHNLHYRLLRCNIR